MEPATYFSLRKSILTMAVTEATFDADLTALVTAQTAFVTAANAQIAALKAAAPPGTDFSAEDATVATATAGLAAALTAISPVAAPPVVAATAALTP